MAQFVGGVMAGLHVNCGRALRPDQCSKSHYQVMNVGKVVGRGDLLPLVEDCVFLLPHMPIPADLRSVQKAGLDPV